MFQVAVAMLSVVVAVSLPAAARLLDDYTRGLRELECVHACSMPPRVNTLPRRQVLDEICYLRAMAV